MTLHELSARLVVVVGASGSGKDSVTAGWLAGLPEPLRPWRARRTITRPAHAESEDHEPVSSSRFEALRDRGAFAFHWSAHGLSYGVRHDELVPLNDGRWVVLSGSRAHLPELLAMAPRAWVVAIDAPAELRAGRLLDRGREADTAVAERLRRELEPVRADLRILNDGPLDAAVATLDAWWRGLAETPR